MYLVLNNIITPVEKSYVTDICVEFVCNLYQISIPSHILFIHTIINHD